MQKEVEKEKWRYVPFHLLITYIFHLDIKWLDKIPVGRSSVYEYSV